MTKKLSSSNKQANGLSEEHAGTGPDHIMDFEMANVIDLAIDNVRLDKSRALAQNGMSFSRDPIHRFALMSHRCVYWLQDGHRHL
jgi:hypothetical protein